MLQSKPSYKDLLDQNAKLQAENKQLRLRPSVHSIDANIIEFIHIKNQMALSSLKASSIAQNIEICISYLLKIPNVHAVAFFRNHPSNSSIDMINEKGLSKNFIRTITNPNNLLAQEFIFPVDIEVYYSDRIKSEIQTHFLHLKKFNTLVIMPITQGEDNDISVLMASAKEFGKDNFFKFFYESILAQLKSSFFRIILYDKLKKQSQELEKKIKSRTTDFERMNKELVRQISTHKNKEQKISEELNLFKSIITQQKDLVLRINTEGQISYSNPQFVNIKAIKNTDKANLLSYFGEGDFPGLELILLDFERGAQRVNCEIQLMISKLTWFSFYFTPIKNKRGLITDIQIVAINIDKNKKEQQQLQIQKDMLYHMLTTSNQILLSFDDYGKVLLTSDTFTQYTGLQKTNTSLINIFDFIHTSKDETIKQFLINNTNQQGKNQIFDVQIQLYDGSWSACNIQITKVNHSIESLNYNLGIITFKKPS